jgi:hypothetical protein
MIVLRQFKVSPSIADPEGIFSSAIVILSESPADQILPELPADVRNHVLHSLSLAEVL